MDHNEDSTLQVPDLREVRRIAMLDALEHSFTNGRLNVLDCDADDFFRVLHPEVLFAALAAAEFVDPDGPLFGDRRLIEQATAALEGVSELFRPEGVVGAGDMNSPYFTLMPFTRAMRTLQGQVDEGWHTRMVDRCVKLYADAAEHINRTHDYLNPRGLEAVSAWGLYRLTGQQGYLDRCQECLDQLLTRLYPCGAQPYHTGLWVWGRRPAQGYQFLTAACMLYLGRELNRRDVIQYVRRIMDYSLVATNRHGEAFVTIFEGLHKSRSRQCAGRQWPIACALGDAKYIGLARTTYELWVEETLGNGSTAKEEFRIHRPRTGYLVALNDALYMGVRTVPEAGRFIPPAGRHVLSDISTIFVHEADRDIAMTVLTGYSAFVEADWGNVKLYALTPELTEHPTYRNAGTDALRTDWRTPSEQIECVEWDGKAVLRGRVFTKWQTDREKDFSRLHNRFLDVTMTYTEGELLLEYHTVNNTQPEPVPSRLLFLLIARPRSASPKLRIAEAPERPLPSADSQEEFWAEGPVGTVRFSAPDSSAIEIVPEESLAEKVVAERPPCKMVPMKSTGLDRKHKFVSLKQANEGSLRLCFEGPNVLERGRYRIRFVLPGS
ncbi:MAG: hypothetical protein J7M40_12775 [Planctomycetes bacterium]|nr:hypothetical protein [Planctomycetota bacterium]